MARGIVLLASVVLLAASGRAPAQQPSVIPAGEVRANDRVVSRGDAGAIRIRLASRDVVYE